MTTDPLDDSDGEADENARLDLCELRPSFNPPEIS